MGDIDFPVVTDSSEQTVTMIIEQDCPECGYDRAEEARHEPAGVSVVECNACGYTHHAE